MRSIRLVCSLFALLLLFSPLAVAQESSAEGPNTGPLTEDERIYHLLSRLSPGPTPALIAEVKEMGIDEWLEKQLSGEIEGSETLSKYTVDRERNHFFPAFRAYLVPLSLNCFCGFRPIHTGCRNGP